MTDTTIPRADVTDRAIAAVGAGAPDDYLLRPRAHAADLPAEAGALKRALALSPLERQVDRYETANSAALRHQARYRRVGRWSVYALLAPIVAGAVVVLHEAGALGVAPGGAVDGAIRSASIVAQFAALSVALLATLILRAARPFDAWMARRAEAEEARVDYFRMVMAAEVAVAPGELPLAPLKLEYFRRYQLALQQVYFARRGADHRRAAWRTRRAQAALAILALLAAAPAVAGVYALATGATSFLTERTEASLLALGLVATGIVNALSALALLDMSDRNAARFESVARNLDHVAAKELEPARAAAATGEAGSVAAFADRVHALMASEHREWVAAWEARPRIEGALLDAAPPGLDDAPAARRDEKDY